VLFGGVLLMEKKEERSYLVGGNTGEETLAFLEECLERNEVPMPTMNQLSIILDELVSNIVKYSGAKQLRLAIMVGEDKVRLSFDYDGDDFDVTKTKDPALNGPAASREIGGLGLLMVKKMADVFTYERQNEHNIVAIEKRYGPKAPKEKL
jgi:anti-sigma regulatory factor (Ser/Thr protein kinase)